MNRLSVRLFFSYLVVVLVSTGVAFATARALAPTFFRISIEQGQPDVTPGSTIGSGGPGEGTLTPQTDQYEPSTSSDTRQGTGSSGTPGDAGSTDTTTTPRATGSTQGPGPTVSTSRPPTSSTTTTTIGGSGSTQGTGSTHGSGSTQGTGSTVSPGTSQGTSTSGRGSTSPAGGDSGRRLDRRAMVSLIDAGMFAADPPVTIVELDEETSRAFRSAIDNSLLVALAVSLVVATGLSWMVARRILSPLARVREATVRLAQGHYSERVPVPAEEELAALAEDVNRLAVRLEATEQRRTRLISDVAHELRTPLTTIQGSMEGLMDRVLEPGDQVWMSVAEEAARLQRVVADLGLLSRLDESALPLELGPLQLDEVVRSVVDRLSPQYQDKQVELLIDVPAGLTVRGDRDRLAQVFTNLVGNALGHTPTGGRVSISGRSAAGMAEVTVTDTGDGIPPDELEDIFERFHRGSGAKRHGTGLGLTIARSLARAHGGDVNAASAGVGSGATFTVRLPKHAKEEERLASWSSQRTGRPPAERVP